MPSQDAVQPRCKASMGQRAPHHRLQCGSYAKQLPPTSPNGSNISSYRDTQASMEKTWQLWGNCIKLLAYWREWRQTKFRHLPKLSQWQHQHTLKLTNVARWPLSAIGVELDLEATTAGEDIRVCHMASQRTKQLWFHGLSILLRATTTLA